MEARWYPTIPDMAALVHDTLFFLGKLELEIESRLFGNTSSSIFGCLISSLVLLTSLCFNFFRTGLLDSDGPDVGDFDSDDAARFECDEDGPDGPDVGDFDSDDAPRFECDEEGPGNISVFVSTRNFIGLVTFLPRLRFGMELPWVSLLGDEDRVLEAM